MDNEIAGFDGLNFFSFSYLECTNSLMHNRFNPRRRCKDESSFEWMMTEIDEANYKMIFLWRKHEPKQSIYVSEIKFDG